MLTEAQLLTVITAIHDKCALADNVDFVFPTGTQFTDKGDFWSFANTANNTQGEIETELINAVWISYLRFTDDDRTKDSPVKSVVFELTVFNEATFERYNEAGTINTVQRKASQTDFDHDVAVFSLQTQFQGLNPLGLSSSDFTAADTVSLAQIDNTQRLVRCAFVPDAIGSQTKFECLAMIQTVAC